MLNNSSVQDKSDADKADSISESYIKIEDNTSEEIDKLQIESDFLLTYLDSPSVSLGADDRQSIQSKDKPEMDLDKVNFTWASTRASCGCVLAFDYASSKVNCCKCGKVFCERCVENGFYVKSQASTKLLFICQFC